MRNLQQFDIQNFHKAIRENNHQYIKAALDNDSKYANVKIGKPYVLSIAVEEGDFKTVEMLLEHGARPNKGLFGGTSYPLIEAVKRGQYDKVKLLLEWGSNVNIYNSFKHTPLHIAVKNLDIKMAQILLEAGADINVKDTRRHTPLYYAALQEDSLALVKILLPTNNTVTPRTLLQEEVDIIIQRSTNKAITNYIKKYTTQQAAVPQAAVPQPTAPQPATAPQQTATTQKVTRISVPAALRAVIATGAPEEVARQVLTAVRAPQAILNHMMPSPIGVPQPIAAQATAPQQAAIPARTMPPIFMHNQQNISLPRAQQSTREAPKPSLTHPQAGIAMPVVNKQDFLNYNQEQILALNPDTLLILLLNCNKEEMQNISKKLRGNWQIIQQKFNQTENKELRDHFVHLSITSNNLPLQEQEEPEKNTNNITGKRKSPEPPIKKELEDGEFQSHVAKLRRERQCNNKIVATIDLTQDEEEESQPVNKTHLERYNESNRSNNKHTSRQ